MDILRSDIQARIGRWSVLLWEDRRQILAGREQTQLSGR
jgi:hypothetical protein